SVTSYTHRLQLWSTGVMEYWSNGSELRHSNTPLLRSSSLLQQLRQLLIEFESAPLQIEGEKLFRILKRDFMLAEIRCHPRAFDQMRRAKFMLIENRLSLFGNHEGNE